MFDHSLLENDDPQSDPVALERAAQRAALDLQRVVALLAQRRPGMRRTARPQQAAVLTWRMLLDIEEQAFADLGFQGRHPATIRDAFIRLADSRLPVTEPDAPVDWQHDEDPLPAIYAIVRALTQDLSVETA
ncbi:hypothetical protein P3T23_008920 [Paraburkholderia sp. GAS448]|uniref:DUF2471 family protein n=1 Tax=Paraburkholderia sp. GAS448 TaxID=3035136 RepID=UPI003D218BEA